MIAVHRFASRAEWLRARRIGSSDVSTLIRDDAPALADLPSYATPYDVWDRLVHGVTEEPPNADQARGLQLEARLARTYAARTGHRVSRPQHTLWSREEWSTSTPDLLVEGEVEITELKTDRFAERWGAEQVIEQWDPNVADVVRVDHYLQVQHQLWTLDRRVADLAVLLPGDDPFLPELRIYRIVRDDELLGGLVERCRRWWRDHVVTRVPPRLEGVAGDRALGRLPRHGSRPATPLEAALAAEYETQAKREKEAREAKKSAGRALVQSAGGARLLELDRGHVTIVQGVSSTELDDRRLLAEHPELEATLAAYRREGHPYAYPRVAGRR